MRIKTVLFDLDGTLLPMDQDRFAKAYIEGLAATAASAGYEVKSFAAAVMAGTDAMMKNSGSKTNEAVFWDALSEVYGEQVREDMHLFDAFYETDFQKLRSVCEFASDAAVIVRTLKEKGFRVVLATNPLFPTAATESRIRWAGLQPEDFVLFTTYETAHFCKPNLAYYREVLETLQVSPVECLMVGNDADEDMIAEELGMQVFLLTDCLINKSGRDISVYPRGSFAELITYIENIEE